MKNLYILICLCFICVQAQAQTSSTADTHVSASQSTDVLIITRTLLAAPRTEKSLPAHAVKNGKIEFSTRQYYARKILKTEGEVHLAAGDKRDFRAGETILLEPGFSVDSTAEFTAEIAAPETISTDLSVASIPTADTLETARPEEARIDVQAIADEAQKPATDTLPSDQVQAQEQTKNQSFSQLAGSEQPSDQVQLWQNQPNPAQETTLIRYYIPDGARTAQIKVVNLSGMLMQSEVLSQKGHGQFSFSVRSLPAGVYVYYLLIDSQEVASRKLVVIR